MRLPAQQSDSLGLLEAGRVWQKLAGLAEAEAEARTFGLEAQRLG